MTLCFVARAPDRPTSARHLVLSARLTRGSIRDRSAPLSRALPEEREKGWTSGAYRTDHFFYAPHNITSSRIADYFHVPRSFPRQALITLIPFGIKCISIAKVIPILSDYNPCAQSRIPMDMMVHG
jgi:hypothetical protein